MFTTLASVSGRWELTYTQVGAGLQGDPVCDGFVQSQGGEAHDALADHLLSPHALQAVQAEPQPHPWQLLCSSPVTTINNVHTTVIRTMLTLLTC